MTINALSSELALSLRPVKHIAFSRICLEWAAVTLASLAIIAMLYGLRPDLALQFADRLFAAEIFLNILLVGAAGLAAVSLAYPDRARIFLLKPLLAMIFTGYSGVLLAGVLRVPGALDSVANATPHGPECLVCILSFAAVPAAWMLWRLRGLASVRPALMGWAALTMAAAAGSLGVRLVESEIAQAGLIAWHYLPLLVLSGAGLILGRKIFRW